VSFDLTSEQQAIRAGVAELCKGFEGEYWRRLDREQAYPEEFVRTLTEGGWLGALVPVEYGGGGLGLADAALILEEINHQGCNAGACHAQMYTMGTVLKHGSDEQKQRYLPAIASGALRLQAFGVTEPDAGSNTLALRTRADRQADGTWLVNGQKIWTSRFAHSDLMLLLARTGTPGEGQKRWWGLSTFLVDLREAGTTIEARPIRTMMNHATVELFINDLVLPADALVGEEGMGFRYILDGMNAERILIAAECVGDGRWFVEKASAYAGERVVFGKPIGTNQGVQFPIARAHAAVEAADLMRWKAAALFDAGKPCGAEANMAKLLASEASWQAANACLDVHGGFGFAEEYDVERKFRETRLYTTAPVNNNLILAYLGQNVLGMPRSY
jgi:acyl-CoA dehydrogenase